MISRSIALLTVGLLGATVAPATAFTGSTHPAPTVFALHSSLNLPLLVLPATQTFARVAQAGGISQSFTWSAQKSDGAITLTGGTPNPAIKSFLTVRAGEGADDQMRVAKGAPDDFVDNSLAGLAALNALNAGRVGFSGTKWTLSGYAESQEALDGLIATLESAVDIIEWVTFIEVAAPVAAAEPEPTVVAPPEMTPALLNWSVRHAADGGLTFDGMVHSAALQSFLRVRAGEGSVDNSEVGGTPPVDFIDSALAAVAAVKSLDSGRASFTGTKWTLNGFAESREALDAVLAGLASATDVSDWLIFVEVSPQAEAPAAPEPEAVEPTETVVAMTQADFQFNALKADGGAIALSGDVPSTAFASYASVIAGPGSINGVSINAEAPEGFIAEAVTAIRALNTLESGLLSFENGRWSLIGDALSDTDAASVSAAIIALPDGDQWVIDVAVVPVFQLCVAVVAEFSDTHTILFTPGSANLQPESATALIDLVAELKKCPAADLHVEGHTDADGPDDANMALSVSRAEAVIAELIELGLDDRRLYAIGYGETLPVATNDTVAGKAQNRRIVFELVR